MFQIFDRPPADPSLYPLTHSPWPVLCILIAYLLFVFKPGRLFMQNRKPYNVKNAMLLYNTFQMVYNSTIFAGSFYYIFIKPQYKLSCMEKLAEDHPLKHIERTLGYMYYLNKIFDLTDTVFFVLRKSYKQISFLHCLHHFFMVAGGYATIRFYGYGGHYGILGLLNSFVHVIMYGYYFLSALSPALKAQIWWKKYITIIQFIQFILLTVHTLYVMFISKECGCPKLLLWTELTMGLTMMYLFSSFYINAYIKRPTANSKVSKNKSM